MSDSGGEGGSSVSLFPRVKWIRHSTMDQASADGVLHSTPMDGWMDFSQGGQGGSVQRAFRISDQSIFMSFFCDKICLQTFWKTRSCDTWTPCCVLVSWQSENMKLSNLIVCDKKWSSIWIRNNQEGKEKTHLLLEGF